MVLFTQWPVKREKLGNINQKKFSESARVLWGKVKSITGNVAVQLLSHVPHFATSWTTACQTPLSSTVSRSLLKFMSLDSVMLSNHLSLCRPLLLLPSIFPSIRVFSSELALHIRQSIGASASASVLPVNIQGWFSLGLTDFITSLSKGLSRVFSSTTKYR